MICPLCQTNNPPEATRCRACGSALKTRLSGNAATPDALPTGALLANTYAVEEVLGQGGFGITYRCHDQMLDRRVAVKEFFPSGCRRQEAEVQASRGLSQAGFGEARAQFLAEARTLARLHHVGIVGVYAAFEANATAYMVMELLHGKTLAQLLQARGGAMNEAEAVGVIERVGEALAFVHGQNLLHRDIKPDNIIVCDDGRVMLIDFGTARETIAGQVQGHTVVVTPGYAPLEQYAKQARRGPFTDVYSIAATLYHLLAGAMPPAASDRAMGVQLRPVRELKPQISPSVAGAVERALQMEIDKRPQSVRAFLDLLHAPVDESEIEPFFHPQIADLPLDDGLDDGDLADWSAALSPDALRARQALWQAGVAQGNPQIPRLQPVQAPPDDDDVPATLTPDAIRARQASWPQGIAGVNPQPVKLAPPRPFPLGANPPKATPPKVAAAPMSPSLASGASGGVKVKNASDPDKAGDGSWWGLVGVVVFLGLLIMLNSGGSRTPATSPSGYSTGVRVSPDSASNQGQDNYNRRQQAEQAWNNLPSISPISVEALPVSKNKDALPTEFAEFGGDIEFSLDATRLAYIDSSNVLRVLNMPDRRVLQTLKLDKKYQPVDIDFAPNKETIAVTFQGRLRTEIWNLISGKRTGVLEGETAQEFFSPLAITDSGELLLRRAAVTQFGRKWALWNPKTKKVADLPLESAVASETNYSVISPDGKTFVTGNTQGRLRWLDLSSGKQISQYFDQARDSSGNSAPSVLGIDYAPNGQWLASRSRGGITVFDSDAKKVGSLAIDNSGLFFTLSPDGEWLAAAGALPDSPRGTLLWNAKTNQKIRLQLPAGRLRDFSFSPDGKQLYGVFADGEKLQFATWNVDAPANMSFGNPESSSFRLQDRWTDPFNTIAQSNELIAIPVGSGIEVRQRDGALLQTFGTSSSAVATLTFSPDGQYLAARKYDGEIQIWDVQSGTDMVQLPATMTKEQLRNAPSYAGKLVGVAFSPDNKYFACERRNGKSSAVELWALEGNSRRLASLSRREEISALGFSADGKTLSCGSKKGLVQLIDVASRGERIRWRIDGPILGIVGALDKWVVVGASQTTLYSSSASDPQLRQVSQLKIPIQQGERSGLLWAVSPDGRLLTVASEAGAIEIHDLPTNALLQVLRDELDEVRRNAFPKRYDLNFSVDGSQLTSLSAPFNDDLILTKTYRRINRINRAR